jgi:hypothetical protein
MSIFNGNLCTLKIISHSIPVKMRNVSDKICRGNQNTFNVQLVVFFKYAFMR